MVAALKKGSYSATSILHAAVNPATRVRFYMGRVIPVTASSRERDPSDARRSHSLHPVVETLVVALQALDLSESSDRRPTRSQLRQPQIAFNRWEAKAVAQADADKQSKLGGLDLALFDAGGRIQLLAQFTMRPYPQLAART